MLQDLAVLEKPEHEFLRMKGRIGAVPFLHLPAGDQLSFMVFGQFGLRQFVLEIVALRGEEKDAPRREDAVQLGVPVVVQWLR